MTPEEESYAEALRRIRKAEKTGAVELDLSGWKNTFTELATLNRVPPELARLTWLQSLNLSRCKQLSGDLSPLAGLTSLQSLDLSLCGFRRFASVESLLPKLKELHLYVVFYILGRNVDQETLAPKAQSLREGKAGRLTYVSQASEITPSPAARFRSPPAPRTHAAAAGNRAITLARCAC